MSDFPAIVDDLLESNLTQLKEKLAHLSIIEIADIVSYLPLDNQVTALSVLSTETATRVFELLPVSSQKGLINAMPSDQSASILNALSPDDRIAFFEELPGPVVTELIKMLTPEERTLTLKQLGYPEESVGRLMTPDYLAIKLDWSIQQVLDYIRAHGRDSETVNVVYVVDDQGRLTDDIRIRELLLTDPTKKVSDISDRKFVALNVNDDEESAIDVFRKNYRVALPVTDAQGYLLGIVTFDDILHLAKEEGAEDIQMIGGSLALDAPYLSMPFFRLMRKRIGWLVVLFLGEMLTATAMGYFEEEIAKAVVLALFLPLIMSSGGNSGSQAATLVICALTMGEVTIRDWWRIMRREIFSGIFLGTVLGSIAFIRIFAWTLFSNLYGPHWFLIAITVSCAIIGVVTWGTFIGSMLPILMKRLGTDPAVSSTPFVATLIDVTGIIIYFGIAFFLLQGTLL